jgi:prolyl oligopeptidase
MAAERCWLEVKEARSVKASSAPPVTRRDSVRDVIHGVEVPDPYRWLEKGDAPETRAWLSAQEEYARPFLDIPIRKQIRARLA